MERSKYFSNLLERTLFDEADDELPVEEAALSKFQLAPDPGHPLGKVGDEVGVGHGEKPVGTLSSGHSIFDDLYCKIACYLYLTWRNDVRLRHFKSPRHAFRLVNSV